MDTTLAIDGYVDAVPAPGARPGTARFHLIVSPADGQEPKVDAPDKVLACTTGDPVLTYALLSEVQAGDLLHDCVRPLRRMRGSGSYT
ncbi:hypothetical protein AB0B21_33495 [Streptomyces rimosus]|uniref:hypothetical protein n=1 Tax=Streptomyces rimosus TaxID=1927 RepID=UPI000517E099|nr:hypothetical protein [Streptomyces rimosus]